MERKKKEFVPVYIKLEAGVSEKMLAVCREKRQSKTKTIEKALELYYSQVMQEQSF